MKKHLLLTFWVLALLMLFGIGSLKSYASDAVTVQVVNELDGSAIEWDSFEALFFNPPGNSFSILTHSDGLAEIEGVYVGDKIFLANDGVQSNWTEIKADGTTVIVCREKSPK